MSNKLHHLSSDTNAIISLLNVGLEASEGSVSITASAKGFAVSINGRRMARARTAREAFDKTIAALQRHTASVPSAASALKQ